MSDRPFTDLLDRLEQGEVLQPWEIKCLINEGRSYVRQLRQSEEYCERVIEIHERDDEIVLARIEKLTEEREQARRDAVLIFGHWLSSKTPLPKGTRERIVEWALSPEYGPKRIADVKAGR